MLRLKPKTVRSDDSINGGVNGIGGGSNKDSGDADYSEVCYDAMSSFNVTVSLQPKSLSSPAAGANSMGTKKSLGSGSVGQSSSSTIISETPSLAASIGNFDADKFDKIAKQALVSDENKHDAGNQPTFRIQRVELKKSRPQFVEGGRTLGTKQGFGFGYR